jgi:hypothetical protein
MLVPCRAFDHTFEKEHMKVNIFVQLASAGTGLEF